MDIEEVRAQVAAGYARLGMPSWRDPHQGETSSRIEECSRVNSPERCRIVAARASVWADTLGARSATEVETMGPEALGEAGADDASNGPRVRCTRPTTLPLVLLTRQVPSVTDAEPSAVLLVCADRASMVLAQVPNCGCDACGTGSDSLLLAVDDAIGGFVGGPSVLLRGPGWYADWRPGAGSSGGDGRGPDHDQMMRLCRLLAAGQAAPLPRGTGALVSSAWLD